MESVQEVLARHPQADPDNVRHTLILLELVFTSTWFAAALG